MVQEFPYLDLSCDVIYLYLHMLEGHKSASSITGTPRGVSNCVCVFIDYIIIRVI